MIEFLTSIHPLSILLIVGLIAVVAWYSIWSAGADAQAAIRRICKRDRR